MKVEVVNLAASHPRNLCQCISGDGKHCFRPRSPTALFPRRECVECVMGVHYHLSAAEEDARTIGFPRDREIAAEGGRA